MAPPRRRAWPYVDQAARAAQPWHLTSGYGLFRRMTGVGDDGQGLATARPELEIFGSLDGHKWRAVRFRRVRCRRAERGAARRAPARG